MKRSLWIALGGTLLAACAALTVDVDVYKGPLSDEKDVLVEEFASMAVGARHLLIQLRDSLEEREIDKAPSGSKKTRAHASLEADRRKDYWGNTHKPIISEHAAAVDAILSLYRDKSQLGTAPRTLTDPLQQGSALLGEAREEVNKLRVTDADRSFVESLPESVQPGKALLQKVFEKDWVNIDPVIGALDEHVPVDVRYRAFADPSKLKTALALREEVLAKFQPRALEVAQAFLALRRKYAAGLDLSLQFIEAVAADASLEPDVRGDAIQSVARISSILVQPRTLVAALGDGQLAKLASPMLMSELDGAARECAWQSLEDARAKPSATWTRAVTRRMADAVERALISAPGETSRGMRLIQASFVESFTPQSALARDLQLDQASAREFGLARAASLGPEEVTQLESAIPLLEDTERSIQGFGLWEGRPDDGLITFINNYLKAGVGVDAALCDPKAVGDLQCRKQQALSALTDALVQFAEKVLFVVNNDSLLREAGTEHESYVMVLQSVGNQILSLANDRRSRDRLARDDKTESEKGVELEALKRAWLLDPEQWLADLLRRIRDDAAEASKVLSPELEKKRAAIAELEAQLKETKAGLSTLSDKEREAEKKWSEANAALDAYRELRKAWTSDAVKDAVVEWKKPADVATAKDAARLDDLVGWLDKKLAAASIADPAHPPQGGSVAPIAALVEDVKGIQKALAADSGKPLDKSTDRDRVQALIIARQTQAEAEKKKALDAREAELGDAKKKIENAHDAAEVEAKLEAAKKDLADAEAGLAGAVKQRKELRAKTARLIEAKRVQFVAEIRSLGADPKTAVDPSTYDDRLLALLSPDDETKQLLRDYGAPTYLDWKLVAGDKSRKGVLDALAASLRQMHIAEVAQAGTDGARARELQAAIDLTTAYRSQAIHLTTPATYLRQSYAVSALQDTSIGWHHELARQLDRALPIEDSGSRARRSELQKDIDRQYWQSINRIRVAGMGSTSYVLVKDDIGNWYVKSYVGDPKDVIEGAKSIALAGISQSLGADAFARDKALRGVGGGATTSGSNVGSQVDFYAKEYLTAVQKDASELRKALEGRDDSVKAAWEKLPAWGDAALELRRKRDELEKDLADVLAARPALPKAPEGTPTSEALAKHCLELLGWSLDLQDAWLAKFTVESLVSTDALTQARADLQTAKDEQLAAGVNLDCAQKELALAQKLAALPGSPPGASQEVTEKSAALDAAKKRSTDAASKLAVAAEASKAAEAKDQHVRAFVLALRDNVREATGGVAERFLARRTDSVSAYQTALKVLGRTIAKK